MTRQSGRRGKSFIQGGRKVVIDALYMPALVAMRFNPDLKTKYQAMIKAGKPPKVAITALMRKLIDSPTHSSKQIEPGRIKALDQDGYSETATWGVAQISYAVCVMHKMVQRCHCVRHLIL